MPAGRLGPLDRLTALIAPDDVGVVDRRGYLQAGRPLTLGGNDGLPGEDARHDRRRARAGHRRAPALLAHPVDHPHRVGRRGGLHRVARTHPALLDLEEAGEVRCDLDRHGDGRRLAAQVPQRDVLAHPVADVSPAYDEQRAVGETGPGRSPGDEGAAVGLVLGVCERLRLEAVEQQLEP